MNIASLSQTQLDLVVDALLANMGPVKVNVHVARKRRELTQTFVNCPRWTSDLLPRLARLALRVELGNVARSAADTRGRWDRYSTSRTHFTNHPYWSRQCIQPTRAIW